MENFFQGKGRKPLNHFINGHGTIINRYLKLFASVNDTKKNLIHKFKMDYKKCRLTLKNDQVQKT